MHNPNSTNVHHDPQNFHYSKITLSAEQRNVLNMVEMGKSVFFTGPAGTGKSVLLREIIKELKGTREETSIAITASTGIAALNIGGRTVHAFAGIGLGKGEPAKIVKNIQKSVTMRGRWQGTRVLIIDEISMIDGTLFDLLEYIARIVRKNNRPFGGIQLILCGDFFQLPPVPDKTYKDSKPSTYAFDAKSWSRCISRPTFLTQVFRQKDPTFIEILTNMRLGTLTAGDIEILQSLSRPLSYADGIEPSQLFPLRMDVENYNNFRLDGLPGPMQQFPAHDDAGSDVDGMPIPLQSARDLLERMIALPMLSLKVGSQVMLIKNVNEHLVNGSLGKVVDFLTIPDLRFRNISIIDISERGDPILDSYIRPLDSNLISHRQSWPVVLFETGERLLCPATKFTIEGRRGNVEAIRTQVPLILAWALSIHKSQGQTLSRVKVDLGHVFEKGQAYVALSRATSMEGLEILNFQASKVLAHPRVIAWHQFWLHYPEGDWPTEMDLDESEI